MINQNKITQMHDLLMQTSTDLFLHSRPLHGEGRWIDAYVYERSSGDIYEVWVDEDGDDKLVEVTLELQRLQNVISQHARNWYGT